MVRTQVLSLAVVLAMTATRWVLLRFTVLPNGTVADAQVQEYALPK